MRNALLVFYLCSKRSRSASQGAGGATAGAPCKEGIPRFCSFTGFSLAKSAQILSAVFHPGSVRPAAHLMSHQD